MMQSVLEKLRAKPVYLFAFAYLFLFISACLMLGSTFSFLIVLLLFYGWYEYTVSKNWPEDKSNALDEGKSPKELSEVHGIAKRFVLHLYLPTFVYCALIYAVFAFDPTNSYFVIYLESNEALHSFARALFPVINEHYYTIVEAQPYRAETLLHIYSVSLNILVFHIFFLLPCMYFWAWQALSIDYTIKDITKRYLMLMTLRHSVVLVIVSGLLYMLFWGAGVNHSGKYSSYDVRADEGFLYRLITLSLLFAYMSPVFVVNFGSWLLFLAGKSHLLRKGK